MPRLRDAQTGFVLAESTPGLLAPDHVGFFSLAAKFARAALLFDSDSAAARETTFGVIREAAGQLAFHPLKIIK